MPNHILYANLFPIITFSQSWILVQVYMYVFHCKLDNVNSRNLQMHVGGKVHWICCWFFNMVSCVLEHWSSASLWFQPNLFIYRHWPKLAGIPAHIFFMLIPVWKAHKCRTIYPQFSFVTKTAILCSCDFGFLASSDIPPLPDDIFRKTKPIVHLEVDSYISFFSS